MHCGVEVTESSTNKQHHPCSKAKVLIGESMITAAPFFEGAGRPSKPYWGPQQGRRVILWEILSLESQQECLTELQNDAEWVIW